MKSSVENDKIKYHEDPAINAGRILTSPQPGEEVVITGIAGKLPESDNIYEFRDNLYNRVDMVTEDDRRWSLKHPEIPVRTGKLLNIDRFDAGFFGIHHREAAAMETMLRLMLERVVEAIIDAGYNPSELEGSKTGVFVASSGSENEDSWFRKDLRGLQTHIDGYTRSILAHRLSYFLKLNGPSYNTDAACSSSLYALDRAYRSIRNGYVDCALVVCVHLCLSPLHTLQLFRLGALSKNGIPKVFDIKGDGFVRSEAAGVLFLQKSKDSRRVYARVLHCKTNCDGFTVEGFMSPSQQQQMALFSEVLEEAMIDPTDVTYVEAHGTGTPVGDPVEVSAIDAVFNKNRKTPLLIGSVKSNAGHGEPASGVMSLIKIILAMENGSIPPNLHFTTPRPNIEALLDGRVQVVTEITPLPNSNAIFGVNSFGLGGANGHAILKGHTKPKINHGLPQDNLPRLICVSGRTKEAIRTILDAFNQHKLDQEYVRLYHQVFSKNFANHHYRGYTILTKTNELQRHIYHYRSIQQSLCVIFSDFSNSWTKFYEDWKELPIFAQSLQRIDNVLKTKNLNLQNLIQNSKIEEPNSSFNQIIGNLAIQIGFADLLKALEIQPQQTLGFGLSEFVCGYYENCLTLEEVIDCVYHVASNIYEISQNPIIYLIEQILAKILTMLGLDISKRKQSLNHAKVNYHNEHFCKIKPDLVHSLSQILLKPKPRPTRWLSTNNNKFASAEYFLESIGNAFALPKKIQNHSVVFEVGNAHLVGSNSINFGNITSANSLISLLENLGRLYNLGCNMDLAKIYPKVDYPVSRSTPMISPYIKWHHAKSWFVARHDEQDQQASSKDYIVKVDLNSDSFSYISGHVIDGRILFPATGYLYLVWEALAVKHGGSPNNYNIVFKNCRFLRVTNVPKDRVLEMIVSLTSLGYFEVIESATVVASGQAFITDHIEDYQTNLTIAQDSDDSLKLTTKDIYKELRLRGYNYSGDFRSFIEYCNATGYGKIRWSGNWVTFLDNMLQIIILQIAIRGLDLPVAIKHLSIDARQHLAYVEKFGKISEIPVNANKDGKILKSGGIEIRGYRVRRITRKRPLVEPILEKYQFVPFEAHLNLYDAIAVDVQLALENTPISKVKVVELVDDATNPNYQPLAPIIYDTLSELPLIHADIYVFTKKPIDLNNIKVEDTSVDATTENYLIVGTKLTKRPFVLNQAITSLLSDGYLLSRESLDFHPSQFQHPQISILTIYTNTVEKLVLCRKFQSNQKIPIALRVDDLETFIWLPKLQHLVKNNANILIYTQNQPQNGILGLINCIRKELNAKNAQAMLINDSTALEFDINEYFYKKQLSKQLAINVYQNGKWGTYRHLKLETLKETECKHCVVKTMNKGDLSSLKWVQGPLVNTTDVGLKHELVEVYYASLNSKDIMVASGQIHLGSDEEFLQGSEFVGRNTAGQRIMGLGYEATLSNRFVADKLLLWPVPDHWTMEDAATVPVVYVTVIFALFMRSSLKPNNSILIHSGTSDIGQAAINVCLHYGCKVFTTGATQEEREFLKKRFPKLTDDVIGCSKDTSFEQMIYRETHGNGVDFVLNSLIEDQLLASVRCLAQRGQFLETSKFDCENDKALQLLFMKKEATFVGVIFDKFLSSNHTIKMELTRLLQNGIANGSVQPLTRIVFGKAEVEKAFRFMASNKSIGKVVIKIRDEEDGKIIKPSPITIKGLPRYRCDAKKTTIILGGLGGFGLELANWLVLRGVKNLVLTSRNGIKTAYQASRIGTWKSYGVEVLISTADITTKSGCEQLIVEATKLAPIQSIFNLAVQLKDATFENQTEEYFKMSFAPKVYATRYLDEITREKCPNLRDFVVFSSVACGRGNSGQTNYAMANSIMERICEKRKTEGYPALAIQWGAIGDVGIVAEMQNDDQILEIVGTSQQRITSCLEVLEIFLIQSNPIVSSMIVGDKKDICVGSDVVETISIILGIKSLKTISMHSTLAELGMDSISVVEIKQKLERDFQIMMSLQEIRNMTFAEAYELQDALSNADKA